MVQKYMDIYIKPTEKAQMIAKKNVILEDIAEVFVTGGKKEDVGKIVVFQIAEEKKKTYLLSVLDVIRFIKQNYPDATISNLGETDILIEYLPKAERKSTVWTITKVAFVSLILFVGAATTIMCFHSDTQIPLIFQNVYYIFFQRK